MLRDHLEVIRDRIEGCQNPAIFTHIRPDGDSVGSVLALGWTLEDMGKNVQFVSEDPIPERYRFLFRFTSDGKDPFVSEPAGADCYILPDISSVDRAGNFFDKHPDQKPDIGIDHHISNEGFCELNWVEPESPAACQVLTGLMPRLGLKLTERVSSALLCGIITDTNSFSNSNVNAQALRYAADLVDNGADIFSICHAAYKEHSLQETAYWKTGMDNMHIEDGLIWSVIHKAERDAIGLESDDDPGFVSYMGNISGIKVSVLFTETNDHFTKVSWRALPGYNVAEVAVAAGGGGHKAASGATIRKPLDETIPEILKITKEIAFKNER